jgi:hypothetical protein
MNHVVEMGSGAMIHIPSFMKIGSDIQKLMEGYTDTQSDDLISIILFLKKRKKKKKKKVG